MKHLIWLLAASLLLSSCGPVVHAASPLPAPTETTVPVSPTIEIPTIEPSLPSTPTSTPTPPPSLPPISAGETPLVEVRSATPIYYAPDPAGWKNWPVLPIVTDRARQIYTLGQALGNDPHAFSVLGDCQSEPAVFMGIYETDPQLTAKLPPGLQETVAWFSGSFNRESPTVKGGTTAGSLLWPPWHANQFTCTEFESPLQCELRIHKPSFVIIHVGTHYESRNEIYMRKVLDQLIAAGVVPILATKADNDDLDAHVNAGYAALAAEYGLPLWNFWAAVGELPNRGLYTRPDAAYQGDIYLIPQALDIQRMSALLVLDKVRRAVMTP